MKTLLLLICMHPLIAIGGELIHPPADWVKLPVTNPDATIFSESAGYASPDGVVRITALKTISPIKTTREADGMIRGQIDSLVRQGYFHEQTETVTFGGWEARHIQGSINSPDGKAHFLYDSYMVFSSSAVTNITVYVDSHDTRKSVDWLLGFITIAGDPITLDSQSNVQDSLAYQLGQKTAQLVMILGAIGVIVWLVLRKNLRDKRSKVLQTSRPENHINDDPY